MTADDLSAPLGQRPAKRRRRLPISAPQAIVCALALFFAVFAVWAIVGDDPFGGEPMVAVPIQSGIAAAAKKSETPEAKPVPSADQDGHHHRRQDRRPPGSGDPRCGERRKSAGWRSRRAEIRRDDRAWRNP
jgi:hypothetical protein